MKKSAIRCFILNDGYAETSSNACILLQHAVGFDTVEEALSDLWRLSQQWIDNEYASDVEFAQKYGKSLPIEKATIEDFWRKAIYGDFQQWPNLWDALVENGNWTTWLDGFEFSNRIVVANTPEMIEEAGLGHWRTPQIDEFTGELELTKDFINRKECIVSYLELGDFGGQKLRDQIWKRIFVKNS